MGYGVIYLTIGEIYPLIIYITLFLLILYILYKYCKAAGYIRLVLPIYHLWTSLLIYIYIRLLGILHLYFDIIGYLADDLRICILNILIINLLNMYPISNHIIYCIW